MIKTYEITKGTQEWQCVVELDEDFIIPAMSKPGELFTTKDGMKSMIEYWTGGEDRLFINDNDITKTFLQQLARECYYIAIQNNYNLIGVRDEFNQREGWWPMDGSSGIKIIFTDDVEIGHDEFFGKEFK